VLARTFALTWVSYASYYLTRNNFSVSKATIQNDLGLSRAQLGMIDTAYLACYCVGQFGWGWVADRVGARRVIGAGMLATAGLSVAFGLSSTVAFFILIFALNGLAQSTGWPSNLKAMTAAMPPGARGRFMGFWSTCYQIGSLVSKPIAGYFLTLSVLGWRLAFFAPAAWVAAVACVVLVLLPEKRVPVDTAARAAFRAEVVKERRRVLRTPLVWALGASYFFMKLIRYVLLFWLPYYCSKELGYSVGLAAVVPLAFELGGFLGAITTGYVSDRFFAGRRVIVGIYALVCLAAAMALYAHMAPLGVAANFLSLALVGFFLFGPDTLLSATAAQDIGGPAAAATAGGVINGLGSIGPILGSSLAASLSLWLGWAGLFQLLGGGAVIGALVLIPFLPRMVHVR
jgi:sugar phosphate permease